MAMGMVTACGTFLVRWPNPAIGWARGTCIRKTTTYTTQTGTTGFNARAQSPRLLVRDKDTDRNKTTPPI